MKKKKKNKKIILILVILFIIFLISIGVILNKKEEPQISSEINTNFQSIEDIIKFYECEYKGQKKSDTEGYDLDIYVGFKYDLFEENESKESFFKMLIENIVVFDNFESIRLIDNEKNITIEVQCDKSSKSIIAIYYNGDSEYFKKEISKRSYDNALEIETINPIINSEILNKCIDENWISKNIEFGTQESTFDKYSIYFDEGYKVRTVQKKVHNLVFTDKYKDEIIGGVKVGEEFSEIENKLGKGLGNVNESLLLYKTKDFYIVFSNKEVSVYPIMSYETEEFEALIDEYNNNKDIINFMDKLTDLWPDYDKYEYDTNYLDILYTLKGVRITYNIDGKNGIRLYENYTGDYKKDKVEYEELIYQLDKSLILDQEEIRLMQKQDTTSISSEENMKYSNRFCIRLSLKSDNLYNNIKIVSLDENYPDNEFDENLEISNYFWIDNYILIYSSYGKGIYKYNAETRETEILVEGDEPFSLKDFDRETKVLKYDEKEINI